MADDMSVRAGGSPSNLKETHESHLDQSKISKVKSGGLIGRAIRVDVGYINGAQLQIIRKDTLIHLLNKNIGTERPKFSFSSSRTTEQELMAEVDRQARRGIFIVNTKTGEVLGGYHIVTSTTPETRSRTSTKVDNTAENVMHGSEKLEISSQEVRDMTAVVSGLKCKVQDYAITRNVGTMSQADLEKEGREILTVYDTKRSNDEYVGITAYQNEKEEWILEIRHPHAEPFESEQLKELMKEAIKNLARLGIEPSGIETVGGTIEETNRTVTDDDNVRSCNNCLRSLGSDKWVPIKFKPTFKYPYG